MMRGLKLVLLVGIFLSLLIPSTALGDTSRDVTVTAIGYICAAPGGLTLTYISDYEVGLSWTKGEDAENTLIRRAFGREPENRSDGYQVYYGSGETASDWYSVAMALPVVYKAWSETSEGLWEEVGTTGEADFMSASFLFIGLILVSGMLTAFAYKVRLLIFTMAAACSWLGLGIWLLLSDSTNLQMSDVWTQVIGLVFILMTIGVLTLQMRTDIRHESQVRGKLGYPGATTESWTTWGPRPDKKVPLTAKERKAFYKERLKLKTGRR